MTNTSAQACLYFQKAGDVPFTEVPADARAEMQTAAASPQSLDAYEGDVLLGFWVAVADGSIISLVDITNDGGEKVLDIHGGEQVAMYRPDRFEVNRGEISIPIIKGDKFYITTAD